MIFLSEILVEVVENCSSSLSVMGVMGAVVVVGVMGGVVVVGAVGVMDVVLEVTDSGGEYACGLVFSSSSSFSSSWTMQSSIDSTLGWDSSSGILLLGIERLKPVSRGANKL